MTDFLDYAAKRVIGETVKRYIHGVPNRRINTGGHGGVFFGKFSYKPGKAGGKASYSKTNCASGTISDKDYKNVTSLAAKQCVFTLGETKSDYNYMSAIRNKMIQRHGESGITQVPLQAYAVGNENKLFRLLWQKVTHNISNKNKHAVVVDIYDLIAKKDMSGVTPISVPPFGGPYNQNHPILLMLNETATEGTVGYTQATRFGSQPDIDDLDFKVERCKRLRDCWGICNKTEICLQPGEQYTHVTWHRKNFVFHKDHFGADLNMEVGAFNGFIKGVSTCSLVMARGRLGHLLNGVNAGFPIIDGVNLDTLTQYSTMVREENPYADKFAFEFTANTWPGENDPRTNVGVMEENTPADTSGI